MCWWPQISGYSYPRVTVIQIDVHPVGEIWYTRHVRAHDKPYAATFHVDTNGIKQGHCSRETSVSDATPSLAELFAGLAHVLSSANQWSSGGKAKHLLSSDYISLLGL
jgi:hypothetical protein